MFFLPADEAQQKRERERARELRRSQWWRQQVGRGKCDYCNEAFPPRELTMDHRIPIVRGGKSTKRNIAVACRSCNHDKKYYLPGEPTHN